MAFGYLTTTLAVADADPQQANEKLLALERIINGRGFVTIRETLNAVEAWLGSAAPSAKAQRRAIATPRLRPVPILIRPAADPVEEVPPDQRPRGRSVSRAGSA